MKYQDSSHITNVQDVHDFFGYLIHDLHCSFHPDDDFSNCLDAETQAPAFRADEAQLLNRLMSESFSVCE